MGVGAAVWYGSRLRVEAASGRTVQAMGVGVLRSREDLPREMGAPAFLSLDLGDPIALYLRLPSSTRGLPLDVHPYGAEPKGIHARLILPDGTATPIGIQRTDERTGTALVQIARDYPPSLPYLDVVVEVPNAETSRFRVTGLPTTRVAFDQKAFRESQKVGAGRIVGRAWWDHGAKPYSFPAVFTAYDVEGFTVGQDEACEMQINEETPFVGPDGRARGMTGMGTLLDASHHAQGLWTATPYAPYVRAVRLRGSIIRRRVFDVTVDFGSVPVRPRTIAGMKVNRGWNDVEPRLIAPRTVTTPSGLRLTLLPKSTSGNSEFALGGQTLSFYLAVDEGTRAKGLPSALRGRGAVGVGVRKADDDSWIFNGIGTNFITFDNYGKHTARQAHLRLRVRRSVILEEPPFSLVLPVASQAQRLYPANGSTMGGGSFEVDLQTLKPVRR